MYYLRVQVGLVVVGGSLRRVLNGVLVHSIVRANVGGTCRCQKQAARRQRFESTL